MTTEFQLLMRMVDFAPTVLLTKLSLWLSRDFVGINPSCCVATRATDVPESEFWLREEDMAVVACSETGNPAAFLRGLHNETISVVCNEGNVRSFKFSLSGKWQLQVSHKRHVCFALKIEAEVCPETAWLMYGVAS